MTINDALLFIKRGMEDKLFRDRLNKTSDTSEIQGILSDQNYNFSYSEFEDAFNKSLTECQAEDNANRLKEFKVWWDLLVSL